MQLYREILLKKLKKYDLHPFDISEALTDKEAFDFINKISNVK